MVREIVNEIMVALAIWNYDKMDVKGTWEADKVVRSKFVFFKKFKGLASKQ